MRVVGIETLQLDTLSKESITTCVKNVVKLTGGSLDMLLNNAGGGYSMPLLDLDLDKARELFDLNVWSIISTTQAFFPLLRKAKGTTVNNTSCAGLPAGALPYGGAYNASKSAATGLTETLRLELQPFDVRVINLMTGGLRSNFHANNAPKSLLPPDSLYNVAKDIVEKTMTGEGNDEIKDDPAEWAHHVVGVLNKKNPPHWIWGGKWSTIMRISNHLPIGTTDKIKRSMTGLDFMEKKLK